MKKVQVTKEEKHVLDNFIKCMPGTFEEKVRTYLNSYEDWEDDYKPLRYLGIEKFVKCLTYDYEIKFDDKMKFEIKSTFGVKKLITSYNENSHAILKGKSKRPIYIRICKDKDKDNECNYDSFIGIGLTIDQAEELIDNLRNLVYQIYEARSED